MPFVDRLPPQARDASSLVFVADTARAPAVVWGPEDAVGSIDTLSPSDASVVEVETARATAPATEIC